MTAPVPSRSPLAVVILTLNEEVNLPFALDSVVSWAPMVIVFDSGSTDRTTTIARERGCTVITHPFRDYGSQRNAAIDAARDVAEWILFLDADEWVSPDLAKEIAACIARRPAENGFYVKRRLIWMRHWIRRGGYYPIWILRLARTDDTRCEARSVNEHLLVNGKTGRLEFDLVHEDRKGVADWTLKHMRYAEGEAANMFGTADAGQLRPRFFGSQAERIRWLRTHVFNRSTPVVRAVLYFIYRYVLRGGFLDGRPGFVFHALHGFWYFLYADVRYLEIRDARNADARARSR
jgi:glycosyltransferase involved in cell wall biosynthesis